MNIPKVPKVLIPSINHEDGSIQSSTLTGLGIILARIGVFIGTSTFLEIPDLINATITTVPAITIISEIAIVAISVYNLYKDDESKIPMTVSLEKWAEKKGYTK